MADNMTLDANELRAVADEISGYCARQREILNVYYAQMMALEDSWKDDKTFGAVIEEIRLLRSSVTSIIDTVNNTYPKYFRKKADDIDNRPTFNNQTIHTTRIIEEVRVPYTSTSYYTPPSVSHINPQLFAPPSATLHINPQLFGEHAASPHNIPKPTGTPKNYSIYPKEYQRDTLKSVVRDTYSNAPSNIRDNLEKNRQDLIIRASKTGGCFYDPCAVSYPTQSSKIAAIDLEADNWSEQLVTVICQHTFYNCGKENNNLLIDSVCKEKRYATTDEAKNIIVQLQDSVNIPEGQTEDEYLHSEEYREASNFFTICYKADLTNDVKMNELLNKYFPNSVAIFKSLIEDGSALNNIHTLER